jgi:hypothetical protein
MSSEALVCGKILYNLNPPLKDVWAFNIFLLSSRSSLLSPSTNYFDLPKIDVRKLIRLHRDASAVDFWRGRYLSDGTLLPLPKMSSTKIYNSLVDDVYVEEVAAHYSDKFASLINSNPNPCLLSSHDIFQCISNSMCSVSAPANVSSFTAYVSY